MPTCCVHPTPMPASSRSTPAPRSRCRVYSRCWRAKTGRRRNLALPVRSSHASAATEEALAPGAPKLWAECRDNECFFFTLGDQRAVEAGFAKADHVTRLNLVFNRVTAATMELRGC